MNRIRWPEFDFSIAWSIFRWPIFDFPTASWILRWPGIDFSHFTFRWTSLSLRSWFDYSVDNVWWTFVTAVETLALVAMLCCFFMFCGCTL
ncbi:Protein-S-isoprenylcysteine O-methyltransferase [Actinidia chinensis var. chinensis]|uniref:Transmembrane protein n=2 Tax=Actinidia TaxID=3624 RepID=A0A7J0DHL3_9ERIC|nr:Protein-S-isoprenylcysteine O-methyltransferase [Actinidia chinensis var. chinensis]GFS35186.1 hypothetical protein Acr_00g0038280 [Actinidia rufa]